MPRMLKIALEGELIEVSGMFVAVPVGQREDVEALTMSTESFGEAVKSGAKKVWEMLAKMIAGAIAAIKGLYRWLRGGVGRNRTLTAEVKREYELALTSILEMRKSTLDEKIASVAKANNHGTSAGKDVFTVAEYDLVHNGPRTQALLGAVQLAEESGTLSLLRSGVASIKKSVREQIAQGDKHTVRADGPGQSEQELLEKIRKFAEAVHEDGSREQRSEDGSHRVPIDVTGMIEAANNTKKFLDGRNKLDLIDKYEEVMKEVERGLQEFNSELGKIPGTAEVASMAMKRLRVFSNALFSLVKLIGDARQLDFLVGRIISKLVTNRKWAIKLTLDTYPELKAELEEELKKLDQFSAF